MDVECEDLKDLDESNPEEDIINEKDIALAPESRVDSSLPANDNSSIEDAVNSRIETTGSSQSVPSKTESVSEVIRSTDQVYENGKRKIKEDKPPTKIVVRRLPPLMSKETFLEQVSPLPSYDYMYFVSGDPSYGIHSFSRAYLNFINQEDVFTFTNTFDNYVFIDAKGQEYPAIVEFSPFQRVPKQRSKKKDTLTGTIDSDPMYIAFKENLLAEALENSKPGAKTMKQHYFETEISTTEEVGTTPLLEFLKQKRAEKARIRDERREEKKRKEAERKLKQKTKDKKEVGEEEETKDIKIHQSAEKSFNKGEYTLLLKTETEKIADKIITNDEKEYKFGREMVLQSKDRRERDAKDKDNKNIKKKEEKEKLIKENRTREFKNRSGKSYQEERIRQAERREERRKETSTNNYDRKSESQNSEGKDNERSDKADGDKAEEKSSRVFIEKRRTYENKKKIDSDDWKGDEGDKRMKTDRNRGERRQRERERKRREEFASRKGFDKKSSDSDRKKSKPFNKSSNNEYNADTKEDILKSNKTNEVNEKLSDEKQHDTKDSSEKEKDNSKVEIKIKEDETTENKDNAAVSQRRKSLESGSIVVGEKQNTENSDHSKRRSSLESLSADNTKCLLKFTDKSDEKSDNSDKQTETTNTENNELTKTNHDTAKKFKIISNNEKIKDELTKSSENETIEQAKITSNQETDIKSCDEKTKNSEITNRTEGSTRNKDPRTDRRIRNKDRPSLQIYRPGMGKFSKQRLEKEKVLGSSTEVDSPSHSPSPTPKVKFPS